jgi:hypothetical protein
MIEDYQFYALCIGYGLMSTWVYILSKRIRKLEHE